MLTARMSSVVTTSVAGEELLLFPEKIMYWKRRRTLVLADPHFGKAATFRAAGIAVPSGTTEADLLRIDNVIGRTDPERLLVLGDFFHAAPGRSEHSNAIELLKEWRDRHRGLRVTVIRGNHDLHAGDPPDDWGFEIIPEALVESPFLFCHDRESLSAEGCQSAVKSAGVDQPLSPYLLSGHTHPAVRLRDVTGATLRLPCFHFGRRAGLLPSFGSFTGNATIRPQRGDQVFVLGEGEIIPITTQKGA